MLVGPWRRSLGGCKSEQRNVVQKISTLLPKAIWEAFSNSPPWWMTNSGCTVEPFNEPSARWWAANKNQEGCGFKAGQSRMINTLGNALATKKLIGTTVSAADENSIEEALSQAKEYDDSSLAFISQMNTHSYYGKSFRKEFGDLVAKYGKRLWQSESGPLSWPGGNQFDVSLWMADVIIKDIRELHANAWIDWQSLSGGIWSSFTTDYGRQKAVPNKRFFMHAQFSRFIRPNSRILTSDDVNTLVALVPSTGNLVLVILNPLTGPKDYLVDLSRFNQIGPLASVYRTSAQEDLVKLKDIPVQNQKFLVELPAQSISTFTLKVAIPMVIKLNLTQKLFSTSAYLFQINPRGTMSISPACLGWPKALDAKGRHVSTNTRLDSR
jgi:O-glycosyl hydrolase